MAQNIKVYSGDVKASPDFIRRAAPPEAARFCKLTLHRAKARKCQTILKTALSRIKVLMH